MTNLESNKSSKVSKKDLTSEAMSNMAKSYQELEKELLVRKEYINRTNPSALRNNYVDPSELPFNRTKPDEPDDLSTGSVEHRPLGVVRDGFKKASFSNLVAENALNLSQPITNSNYSNRRPESKTKLYDDKIMSFGQTKQSVSQQQSMVQAAPINQNPGSNYTLQQASAQQYAGLTTTTLQNTATATAANNIDRNMTYKTSLMRTHAREDTNIEDIHCQIVMRVHRNKQILYELEGGPGEKSYLGLNFENGDDTVTRSNSMHKNMPAKKTHEQSVIQLTATDMEVLGPDFCAKRPIFLAPNQTKMPLNGTLNMQNFSSTAFGVAKSMAPIKGQPAGSKATSQQSAGPTDVFNSS